MDFLDSNIYLVIIFVLAAISVLMIVLSHRKNADVKRFTRKNPDAIWVHYYGDSTTNLSFSEIEEKRGIAFDYNPGKRGIVVLPGPVRIQITYFNILDKEGTSFTQLIQFTATKGLKYSIEVDEANRIISITSK